LNPARRGPLAMLFTSCQEYSQKPITVKVRDVLDYLDEKITCEGLDFLAPPGRKKPHNLARPRRYEVVAALNRLRSCKMSINSHSVNAGLS